MRKVLGVYDRSVECGRCINIQASLALWKRHGQPYTHIGLSVTYLRGCWMAAWTETIPGELVAKSNSRTATSVVRILLAVTSLIALYPSTTSGYLLGTSSLDVFDNPPATELWKAAAASADPKSLVRLTQPVASLINDRNLVVFCEDTIVRFQPTMQGKGRTHSEIRPGFINVTSCLCSAFPDYASRL
jgi:hypothetical protein